MDRFEDAVDGAGLGDRRFRVRFLRSRVLDGETTRTFERTKTLPRRGERRSSLGETDRREGPRTSPLVRTSPDFWIGLIGLGVRWPKVGDGVGSSRTNFPGTKVEWSFFLLRLSEE